SYDFINHSLFFWHCSLRIQKRIRNSRGYFCIARWRSATAAAAPTANTTRPASCRHTDLVSHLFVTRYACHVSLSNSNNEFKLCFNCIISRHIWSRVSSFLPVGPNHWTELILGCCS